MARSQKPEAVDVAERRLTHAEIMTAVWSL
jgi:hypothetical protein